MIHAAIFSAEKMIRAGLGVFEPLRGVTPGNNVGLDAERRYEEVVNYIFSRHDQLDATTDRHVQLVDLTLAGGVLNLPHPLLPHDINLDSILRRTRILKIKLRAPREHAHRDNEGDH